MTKKIEFGITEDHFNLLDEVRATLNIISVMGMNDRSEDIPHLSKSDLITVLDSLQFKLKKIQQESIAL